jgi:rubredoxin
MNTATCPVCAGSKRVPAGDSPYKRVIYGYDEATDTFLCRNCGGQTMSCVPQGVVPVDPGTGLGCVHSYVERNAGRCYTINTCSKCGHQYDIDSGD